MGAWPAWDGTGLGGLEGEGGMAGLVPRSGFREGHDDDGEGSEGGSGGWDPWAAYQADNQLHSEASAIQVRCSIPLPFGGSTTCPGVCEYPWGIT